MRGELGGLGQLTTVRIEQALQEAGRAPIGIERETAEQVGEALGRRYLAVIDRTPALGFLPAFLQGLVKGLEREVGAPCAEDRVEMTGRRADGAPRDRHLGQPVAIEAHQRVEEVEEDGAYVHTLRAACVRHIPRRARARSRSPSRRTSSRG